MTFELLHTDSKTNARAGLITTDHGQIETPIFMPVGTLGSVKGVHLNELKEDTDYALIETVERESIALLIQDAVVARGMRNVPEDVTEDWRDW